MVESISEYTFGCKVINFVMLSKLVCKQADAFEGIECQFEFKTRRGN